MSQFLTIGELNFRRLQLTKKTWNVIVGKYLSGPLQSKSHLNGDIPGGKRMAYTAEQLLQMTEQQLDDLFSNSPAGDIPNGEAVGTAIIAAGTKSSPEIAHLINIFTWQGKNFDASHGTLTNRILAFGVNAIVAQIYKTPSWFDGKECIVLDYSKTSILAKHIRDEIRQIGPGAYLGIVYWDKKRTIHFSLQFPVTS